MHGWNGWWGRLWNCAHPLILNLTSDSLEWVRSNLGKPEIDPLALRKSLTENPNRAAAWIFECLRLNHRQIWNGLIERAPDFLREVWAVALSEGFTHLVIHTSIGGAVIRPDSWEFSEMVLPDPGEDWKIRASEEDARI